VSSGCSSLRLYIGAPRTHANLDFLLANLHGDAGFLFLPRAELTCRFFANISICPGRVDKFETVNPGARICACGIGFYADGGAVWWSFDRDW
jgi:hypothetical protein